MADDRNKITEREVRRALCQLWNDPISGLSVYKSLPSFLQEAEEFSEEVCHFDSCWDKLKTELRQEADRVGMQISESEERIEIRGSKYATIIFQLVTFEGDLSNYPIEYEALDGMTKEEAIDYLNELPDEIEEFKYVTISLEGGMGPFMYEYPEIMDVYPAQETLENLFNCFLTEEDVIDEALKRTELKVQKADRQRALQNGTYKRIKNALREMGWTGKFSVEHGYAGCVLMILMKEGGATRIGGSADDIIKQLPEFIKFCNNYPYVENATAFIVRSRNLKDTVWETL